jgi:hypothetical protein
LSSRPEAQNTGTSAAQLALRQRPIACRRRLQHRAKTNVSVFRRAILHVTNTSMSQMWLCFNPSTAIPWQLAKHGLPELERTQFVEEEEEVPDHSIANAHEESLRARVRNGRSLAVSGAPCMHRKSSGHLL